MLAELGRRIGAQKMGMWFAHTHLRLAGQTVEVLSDSPFVAKWIDSHFADDLRSIARDVVGTQADVQIKTAVLPSENGATPPIKKTGSGEGENDEPQRPRRPSNRPATKATALRRLSEFVVGPTNRLAYSAACRLAEESDPRMSPLFIHGDCGVGKTHLLQGICHRYIELTSRAPHVRYVTGEQFTNEYITAIRSNTIDAFRSKIRKLDLLAIDDVHFLSNKVRTQTEFLYTLDAIDLSGARVVLASDNHPHHIKRFSQSLVSRFLSGMVVKIDPPDRATRIALIQRLAASRGLKINPAAVELIADNCLGSVRELEGSITKLAAYRAVLQGNSNGNGNGAHLGYGAHHGNGAAHANGLTTGNGHSHRNGTSHGNGHVPAGHDGPGALHDEIGVVLAEQLFREQAWSPAQAVRIANIVEAVCARLGVSKADVIGSGRHRRVVLARGLIAYLGRELTTHSFPEIAQALGRSNHSTIHTADQRLRKQLVDGEPFDFGTAEGSLNLKELSDQLRRALLQRKP
jgi:chromosomal replication initiator protein